MQFKMHLSLAKWSTGHISVSNLSFELMMLDFTNIQLKMRISRAALNGLITENQSKKKQLKKTHSIIRRNKSIHFFLNTYEWTKAAVNGAFLFSVPSHPQNIEECEIFLWMKLSMNGKWEQTSKGNEQKIHCIFWYYCKNSDFTIDLVGKMIKFSFSWIRNT